MKQSLLLIGLAILITGCTTTMTPSTSFTQFDNDAKAGECFVKPGVAVLRRPDQAPYDFSREYECVHAPDWQVSNDSQRIEMRQQLDHDGYGYDLISTIELSDTDASFVSRHHMTNTGSKLIYQFHYSHNFITMGELFSVPGCGLEFPFTPMFDVEAHVPMQRDGTILKFNKAIPPSHDFFSTLAGFGDSISDNAFTLRNRERGIELRVTGDCSVMRYHLFATPRTICPEPFVEIDLAAGETMSWQHRYELISGI